MSELGDRFIKDRQLLRTAKKNKSETFGMVVGALIANVTAGASYALGALLVWDVFFR